MSASSQELQVQTSRSSNSTISDHEESSTLQRKQKKQCAARSACHPSICTACQGKPHTDHLSFSSFEPVSIQRPLSFDSMRVVADLTPCRISSCI
jgi:hypothetical protein